MFGSGAGSRTVKSIPKEVANGAVLVPASVPVRRGGSRPVGPLPNGALSLGGRASICLRRAFSASRTSMRSSSAARCCFRRALNARWTSRARDGGRLSLRFRPREDMVGARGGGLAPASDDGGVGLLEILTDVDRVVYVCAALGADIRLEVGRGASSYENESKWHQTGVE